MDDHILERLQQVASDVFDVSVNEIQLDTSPATIVNWDSLGHANLIVGLESEFNISFTPDEVADILNIEEAFQIIKHKN